MYTEEKSGVETPDSIMGNEKAIASLLSELHNRLRILVFGEHLEITATPPSSTRENVLEEIMEIQKESIAKLESINAFINSEIGNRIIQR